jgi:5-methylcytosine-specific restriction endonuclease McrA
MSLEEEAIFCRQLDSAALRGDEEFLKQFPFIGRVFVGTAKRKTLAPSIKNKVLSAGKCAYCESTEKLQVDHIVPYSKGGTHDISNLQCLCRKCNRAKSDMTEEEYFKRLAR